MNHPYERRHRRHQSPDAPEHRHHRRGGFGPGGPHGPHGPHGRGGRGGRAQRGDVRAAALLLLADSGPMHGYQLMQEIAERTDGAWRPSPGAVYPALSLLEDEGLVTITQEAGRKQVSLTDEGRSWLETNRETLGDPFAAVNRDGTSGVRPAIEGLMSAFRQVARSGSAAQLQAAVAVMDEARRSIYLILADAGQPEPPAGD